MRQSIGKPSALKSGRIVIALLAVCAISGNTVAAPEGGASHSVELASGLTLKGRINEATLRVSTVLGQFEVPADQLQTLVPREPSRVTYTLVTRRGDVLVGKLAGESLRFTALDGSQAELKLNRINRLSGADSAAPTTAPASTSAVIVTLEGDQLAVEPPQEIEFRTRTAPLRLGAEQIYEIVFSGSSQAAHQIRLTDGSSLSGFVVGEWLSVQPRNLDAGKLKVRIATLRQLDFASSADSGADGPRLELVGGDVLRGGLRGELVLQTELGALPIAADKIERIAPVTQYPGELAVTLADGRTIKAPAATAGMTCQLTCGVSVQVPVEMIAGYARSAPGFLLLAATPDRSRGLAAPLPSGGGGDGAYTIAEQYATRCWRQPPNNYLYFQLDEKRRPWRGGDAVVEAEYFDSAAPGEFKLEYDSTETSQPFNGAYKTNPNMVKRSGSGRWKVARFEISDARFTGSQNMHADFRLHFAGEEPLMIRAVRLHRAAAKSERGNTQ
jgi:hypothetical protein